ncbi:MAG TPA: hypothetical protein VIR56_04650 [Solimonas sp.]
MRYLIALAALVALSAHAEAPPTAVSGTHLQQANTLAQSYRQCLQDTLGERYINVSTHDPVQLAAEVEKSCEPKLVSVSRYLDQIGYTAPVVTQTIIEIKAKADGAAIAYVHSLPAYRF